ncbi:hypothetical protein MNBD_GAMMA12-2274, partial [hydrothermal vent metagenome]
YGGMWSRKDQVWLLNESDAIKAGLTARIVD